MNLPWMAGNALPKEDYRRVRREAIFRYHKWDQQVGDVATLCPFPLIVQRSAWNEVAELAESLAEETQTLEKELAGRPDLWSELGLPTAIVRAMRAGTGLSLGKARLIRFDFHFTDEGWKISEANTDVPGGWNEATGYPALMAPFYSLWFADDAWLGSWALRGASHRCSDRGISGYLAVQRVREW